MQRGIVALIERVFRLAVLGHGQAEPITASSKGFEARAHEPPAGSPPAAETNRAQVGVQELIEDGIVGRADGVDGHVEPERACGPQGVRVDHDDACAPFTPAVEAHLVDGGVGCVVGGRAGVRAARNEHRAFFRPEAAERVAVLVARGKDSPRFPIAERDQAVVKVQLTSIPSSGNPATQQE